SSNAQYTMAESWNGSAWTIRSTPSPGSTYGNELSSVSCTSAASCIAVGSDYSSSGPQVSLAEGWDGTAWTVQTSPSLNSGATLSGVACVPATTCTAVGSAANALAERD